MKTFVSRVFILRARLADGAFELDRGLELVKSSEESAVMPDGSIGVVDAIDISFP